MAPRTLLPLCLAIALLAACDAARSPVAGDQPAAASTSTCTRCHGTGDDPAPPRATNGDLATTSVRVGAHQAHLKDGALHRAFACSECHVVPTDTSHLNGDATVTFGPTANARGVASTWDRSAATCATYCHGAALAGGSLVKPVWTAGPSQAACGSCHGAPPPAPHPQGVSDCGGCHEGYTASSVNLALHVDGKVQVASAGGAAACGSCHTIPPSAPHVQSTSCGNCHPGYTSTSVVAATHQNGVVDVAISAASCTSCHGAPPAAPHVQSTSCADCHSGYTSSSANPATHQNGTVDVTLSSASCTSCHGAPPAAPHVQSTSCGSCHAGYTATSVNSATHRNGTVDVAVSSASCTSCHGAPPPAPHAQSTSCGDCHPGYTSTSVVAATHQNGTVDVAVTGSCTSCHGAPPSSGSHGDHSGRSCGDCHGSGYSRTAADPATHMNGSVQTGNRITSFNGSTCTNSCHGSRSW